MAGVEHDREPTSMERGQRPTMPRWVKVSLVVVAVVLVLFLGGKATGLGGDHGPGRHGGGNASSSEVDEGGGNRPPVDREP